MEPCAIELDHNAGVGPERVDLEAGDPRIQAWPRQACVAAEPDEPCLELAARDALGRREQLPECSRAAAPAAAAEDLHRRRDIQQPLDLGVVHRALELV